MPLRIVTPQAGGGTRIGSKAQIHERWRSPIGPFTRLACGPDEAPQPCHGRSGQGLIFIPRTSDHGNHNMSGNLPPVLPPMELGEIIRPHNPDKSVLWIASDQLFDRIDRVSRAQFAFDRCRPNAGTAGHFPRRRKPRLKWRHVLGALFQGISGRHQPPDLVQIQRFERKPAYAAMSAMGRIKRAAEKTDGFSQDQPFVNMVFAGYPAMIAL